MKRLWLIVLIILVGLFQSSTFAQEDQPPLITSENIQDLAVSQTFFRGRVSDAKWTPDGEILVVAAAKGLWLYDANDYTAEPQFLSATQGWVRSLAISSTGQIATGHQNGVVTLWDGQTFTETHFMTAHVWPVLSLDFNVEGTQLASVSGYGDCFDSGKIASDDRINIWNTQNGELFQSFLPEQIGVYQIAFSPDGQSVGAAGTTGCQVDHYDAFLQIFDLQSGERIEIPNPYEDIFEAPSRNEDIHFSPDGKWWVTNGQYGMLIWDRAKNEVHQRLEDVGYADLVFSPSREQLAMLAYDPECEPETGYKRLSIVLMEMDTWQMTDCFATGYDLAKINYHPTQQQVVTLGYFDQTVRIWDLETQTELSHLDGFSEVADRLTFRPNTDELLFTQGQKLIALNYMTGEEKIIPTTENPSNFVISPDGQLIAYAYPAFEHLNSTLYVEQLEPHQLLWQDEHVIPEAEFSRAISFTFSLDSFALQLIGEADGNISEIQIREARSSSILNRTPLTFEQAVWFEPSWSPDGQLLAVSLEGKVNLMDLATGNILATLPSEQTIYPQFSPDGRYVTGQAGQWNFPKTFVVGEVESGVLLLQSNEIKEGDWVFTPDSRLLIHASNDLYEKIQITVLDTQTWRILATFYDFNISFVEIAISPDGRLLATSTDDGTVQIWSIEQ